MYEMAKFRISYEEERPGWDEFNKVRFDTTVVEADTSEEALAKFKADPYFKYCFYDDIVELR